MFAAELSITWFPSAWKQPQGSNHPVISWDMSSHDDERGEQAQFWTGYAQCSECPSLAVHRLFQRWPC